ncbi:uncharacterized protein MONBRDRAFT_6995 [Monosiga brevicollis MX1]|uniref:Uncharacterized protein n=1 Tax=Monosiga brevicollis TaxID=81824 RepID=A9UVL0_MONBE|nr:uncharacterized protein MONBRDRAFT_6995 [Monosiga brevicollis MX1]EDQ90601.1 predicted protein [Monosiga brevicollis MX1]|eukprot:XP_001744652.1 hypothetical protein [Monosiga brevicollis MX1]
MEVVADAGLREFDAPSRLPSIGNMMYARRPSVAQTEQLLDSIEHPRKSAASFSALNRLPSLPDNLRLSSSTNLDLVVPDADDPQNSDDLTNDVFDDKPAPSAATSTNASSNGAQASDLLTKPPGVNDVATDPFGDGSVSANTLSQMAPEPSKIPLTRASTAPNLTTTISSTVTGTQPAGPVTQSLLGSVPTLAQPQVPAPVGTITPFKNADQAQTDMPHTECLQLAQRVARLNHVKADLVMAMLTSLLSLRLCSLIGAVLDIIRHTSEENVSWWYRPTGGIEVDFDRLPRNTHMVIKHMLAAQERKDAPVPSRRRFSQSNGAQITPKRAHKRRGTTSRTCVSCKTHEYVFLSHNDPLSTEPF